MSDSILMYQQLEDIKNLLKQILEKENQMTVELDELVTQVAETKGVEESALVFISGILQKLDAAIAELEAQKVDAATLVDLKNQLHTSETALAEALAANP